MSVQPRPSRLSLPARKVCGSDLFNARPCRNNTDIPDLKVWSLENTEVSILWIQGKVVKISQEEDSFCIDDETANILVTNASGVPKGCPPLQQGSYVLVIGELQSVDKRPIVKAMKIQDLSGEDLVQKLWHYEVQDLKNL